MAAAAALASVGVAWPAVAERAVAHPWGDASGTDLPEQLERRTSENPLLVAQPFYSLAHSTARHCREEGKKSQSTLGTVKSRRRRV